MTITFTLTLKTRVTRYVGYREFELKNRMEKAKVSEKVVASLAVDVRHLSLTGFRTTKSLATPAMPVAVLYFGSPQNLQPHNDHMMYQVDSHLS